MIMEMKKLLLGMTMDELRQLATANGEKEYRGKQLADWIYRQGCREIGEMTNLPEALKIKLAEEYVTGRSEMVKMRRSKDGTFKLLLRPAFGELVETVGMPYPDRFSCCISTQVGCSIGCAFCATGAGGFKRNLAAGEIIDQVLTVQDVAFRGRLLGDTGRVSHVVFMGMGEPLINYDATFAAVKLLNTELNIGMRNITVSTIGYVPGIYRMAKEHLQLTLAVSLHASEDMLRRRLVPGMSRYKLKEIVDACRHYFNETGRRVTFEYCLLKAVNDTAEDAARLALLLKGVNCHINLIPYNVVEGCGFKSPEPARVAGFRQALEDAGLVVTQREQRGAGIDAACGQLRRKSIQ
ncbi:MAG: 23S rRNA (adenine(2503)-C(2))-methyltransferase RlmN [Dehalococcoidia bacterium]|nr:23S rRNA (adenine(2503)-C(2))-methyltransferase RlmN [Dehalococcoidia bacterium]